MQSCRLGINISFKFDCIVLDMVSPGFCESTFNVCYDCKRFICIIYRSFKVKRPDEQNEHVFCACRIRHHSLVFSAYYISDNGTTVFTLFNVVVDFETNFGPKF